MRSDHEWGSREKCKEAERVTRLAFLGEWGDIDLRLVKTLRKILPAEIEKCSIFYDLEKSPGKYMASTKRICDAMGEECKVHFLPLRRSWVPCHVKFDTKSVVEMFTPNK